MARSARGRRSSTGSTPRPKRRSSRPSCRQVQVRFDRDPLRREAILSGRADPFQREGMGQFPGLNDRIRAVPGVSGVRWEGE